MFAYTFLAKFGFYPQISQIAQICGLRVLLDVGYCLVPFRQEYSQFAVHWFIRKGGGKVARLWETAVFNPFCTKIPGEVAGFLQHAN
jgi:hypothetical protein